MNATQGSRLVLTWMIGALASTAWAAPGAPAPAKPAAPAAAAVPQPAAPKPAAAVAKPTPAPAKPAPAAAKPAPAAAKAAPAAPQPAPAAAKPMPANTLGAARELLDSPSSSQVHEGLLALASIGGDGAARALASRMHRGLPPSLLREAIDVAVQIGSTRPAPELLELVRHKRPAIRQQALSALAALKVKTAQNAVLEALDDPSVEVRSAAVSALAAIGSARALPALLALVDRGQPGALEALGRLAGARDLPAVLERAKGGDVTPLKPALQGMMTRAELPLGQKLAVVAAIEKLGSPSARTCLVEWLNAFKADGHPRLRAALFDSIKRLDAAPSEVAATSTTKSTTVVQGVKLTKTTQSAAGENKPAAAGASAAPPAPAGESAKLAATEGRTP